MDNFNECLKYFKSNIGFNRFMKKVRNKYKSLDKISGTVVIENPTSIEKDALSGFMKKDYSRNKFISINMIKFINRLDQTKFSGINFKEILDAYFNEDILSKRKMKIDYESIRKKDFEEILNLQLGKRSYEYIYYLLLQKGGMYKRVVEIYNVDKKMFFDILNNVCLAINNIPDVKEKLSVFTASITRNPHYFDNDRLEGKILIDALSYLSGIQRPTNTEGIARILYINNILIDDVSNMVLCFNLKGYTYYNTVHPIWSAMCDSNESLQITLSNLASITKIKSYNDFVLVVENPNVFTSLTSMLKKEKVSIICTYGQVKLSALYLLDMLVRENTMIYYSGDIDPEGVIIADKLKQRYKENIKLVYFDKETYLKSISSETLNSKRLKKLSCVKSIELDEVKKLLLEYRKATYEELNLEGLYNFIKKKLKSS